MQDPRIAENSVLTVAGIVVALLLILSACAPEPRSAARQGVPVAGLTDHNAGYFTGADPDFPRLSESGGGGAGGD
jgi:hypothetical protein